MNFTRAHPPDNSCEACHQRPAFVRWHGRGYWEIALCAQCWLDLPQEDRDLVCHLIDRLEADDLTRGIERRRVEDAHNGTAPNVAQAHVVDSPDTQPPARDLFEDLERATSRLFDALEGP